MTDTDAIVTEAGKRLLEGEHGYFEAPLDVLIDGIRAIEAEAAQRALDDVRVKVEKVIDNAEPDENWEGEFVDWIVPHDDMLDLQAVLAALQDRGADREDVK